MRNILRLVGLIMGITSTAVAGGNSPKHKIVSQVVSTPTPEIERKVLTIQEGNNAFNRFDVVHLHGDVERHTPPVILLAPFGFPAEFWEQSDDGSYADAFAPQIALAGYDVWLVDSRLAQAAPGECESGAVDCSPMKDWGVDTAVRDALYVTHLARKNGHREKPVIGGLSGGSATALAAINDSPSQFSGLFLWEGTLVSDDPAIAARNAAFCADDQAAFASGTYYDGSVQIFKLLFSLAASDPEGLSPIPVFPPGTTNLQALLFALSSPDPTNPLNFTDTFVRFVGNPFTTTLAFSDIDRVVGLGSLAGNYAPIAFIRDSHCSMGGVETRFTNRLHKFRGKVLIFAEGLGFNTMMLDTSARLTKADVTVNYQPTFGESDRFFNVDWENVGLEPFLDWLD